MINSLNHGFSLPPEQQAIRDKCFHPSGVVPDFTKDEVESSIPERFETIVRRHPDRPAVKVGNRVLTYALINDMANRIARSILRRRSEQSEPIALMFRKGAEQIAAMLGVLKAGKILVVVDPLFPEERIRTMICDSQAPWLVCDAQSIGLAQCVAGTACDVVEFAMLDQDITGVDLPLQMSPAAFACLIYSSGSTGQPKGIIQNHRNILHTTWIRVHDSNACYNDRVADLTSGTANSIFDMLLALLSGATLLPFDVRNEGAKQLASWMVKEGVSLCWISSRLFRTFCQSLTGTEWFPSLRFLRLRSEAGQREDFELFKNHFSRHCIFGTGLSSSETGYLALYAIDHECTGVGEDLPVGYLAMDKEIRLLDDCGNDVGRNVVGEGEVEKVLQSHPAVREAVVVTQENGAGESRLVAYYTSRLSERHTVSDLRKFINEKLPDHMTPSAFVRLDALPLTPNGKVDRRALPDPGNARPNLTSLYAPPATTTEEQLTSIWSELLSVDQVGIRDNFFDLGGHSLTASRVISRVIQTFQLELPVKALFDAPTVAEMAAIVEQNQAKRANDAELAKMLREVEAMTEEEAQKLLAK